MVLDCGLNPGPPALEASTIPQGYPGGGVMNSDREQLLSLFYVRVWRSLCFRYLFLQMVTWFPFQYDNYYEHRRWQRICSTQIKNKTISLTILMIEICDWTIQMKEKHFKSVCFFSVRKDSNLNSKLVFIWQDYTNLAYIVDYKRH